MQDDTDCRRSLCQNVVQNRRRHRLHAVIFVMIHVFGVTSCCQKVSWPRWVQKCSRELGIPIARLHATEGFFVVMCPKGPRPFSYQEEQWRGRAGPRLVVSICVCVDAELEEEKGKLEMLEDVT